ncbi:MAG: AMP-binding protein [Bdellovibrionaceae bacterium]|nr:AMP-binding protein [Pseudobdellovibrionaceae bacterium]
MNFREELLNRIISFPEDICIFDYERKAYFKNKDLLELLHKQMKAIKKNNTKNLPVAIFAEKSFHMYASLLACTFLGLPFIPVKNKKSFENLVKLTPLFELQNITGDNCSDSSVKIYPTQSEIMYIVPTSGTTGLPKLIQISYSNFSNYLKNIQFVQPITKGDCVSQVYELTFDPSIGEIFHTLIYGGVLAPFNFKALLNFDDWLVKSNISRWGSSPSQAALIIERLSTIRNTYPQINESSFIGEGLSVMLVNRWRELFPNSDIFNHYGPAETTVSISSYKIPKNSSETILSKNGIVSIGQIYHEHKFKVLNEQGDSSQIGELCISGPQVMMGYINNTTKFYEESNQKYYRTGDNVEFNNDHFFYLGRLDDMIKIKSERYHTAEIEHYIEIEINSKTAIIPAFHNQFGQAQGTILIITKKLDIKSRNDLSNKLIGSFGKHLAPKLIYYIESFPLSDSGKLDKKKLFEMYENNLLQKLD